MPAPQTNKHKISLVILNKKSIKHHYFMYFSRRTLRFAVIRADPVTPESSGTAAALLNIRFIKYIYMYKMKLPDAERLLTSY